MEVATADDLAGGQDQGVVGDGVRLDLQRAGGHAQDIHRRAGDLWLAADAIGVLHAGIAVAVAVADRRSRQEGAHRGRSLDLARVAAQGVDFGL